MIEIFKVLGDENRLRILNLLISYELCVCEIEVILKLSQSNISRHLSKLKNAGLIEGDKDAQWIHYKIKEEFKLENKLLFNYLSEKFLIEKIFINDIERCKKYKQSSYTCKTITNDINIVLNYLNS